MKPARDWTAPSASTYDDPLRIQQIGMRGLAARIDAAVILQTANDHGNRRV